MGRKPTQPVKNWKFRRRAGLPMISRHMLGILLDMRTAHDAGYKVVGMEKVHGRTIRSLLNRGWIAESPGLDGLKYYLTVQGKRAVRVYEQPPDRRWDGMCPTCCERPKQVYSSGKTGGYCKECNRESNKRQRLLKRPRLNPDRPCSTPGCANPVYVSPRGVIRTYCETCFRQRRHAERESRKARKLARIAAGDVPVCMTCGQHPVRYTKNAVSDYCPTCERAYHREYHRRQREARHVR